MVEALVSIAGLPTLLDLLQAGIIMQASQIPVTMVTAKGERLNFMSDDFKA